jgi:hypothetical protein
MSLLKRLFVFLLGMTCLDRFAMDTFVYVIFSVVRCGLVGLFALSFTILYIS